MARTMFLCQWRLINESTGTEHFYSTMTDNHFRLWHKIEEASTAPYKLASSYFDQMRVVPHRPREDASTPAPTWAERCAGQL